MEKCTPVYTIAYAIMNSMESLRFGKEDYFYLLISYTGYFVKEIEDIFSRVSICYRNTHLKLINNSLGKHKVNQHRDGVWICDETLA